MLSYGLCEKGKEYFFFQNKKSPCQWLVNKAIEQSNYCGFGISDFGNKENHLCFLQNTEAYTSEIQHPKSEIA